MKNIVLMYHGIAENFSSFGVNERGAEIYCIKPAEFQKQMEYVAEMDSRFRGNDTRLVITFDDGLESDYTQALPLLKKLGLKAYFFILVGRVGTKGYMNWQQIKELKEAGMIIGAHGLTHRILTDLNELELEHELKESKKILETNLQTKIEYMSIPRGLYNANVIKKAKEIGYKNVFTSNPFEQSDFCIGRIAIKGNCKFEYFKKVADNGLCACDKIKYIFRTNIRKLLGDKFYDRIRTNLLKTND